MIKDGDEIDAYVSHGVHEPNQTPLELEFIPNRSESGVGEESLNEASNPNNHPPSSTIVPAPSTFTSNTTNDPSETSSTSFEVPPNIVHPPSTFPSNPTTETSFDHDPGDDEMEDESRSEGDINEESEVDSDVHQEYIDIRASKRHFKRSQGRSRGTTSNQIHVGEKGPDLGYDETNISIRESLVGKLRRC
ncbi:hypothetical protein R3W88_027002 [Solanum pinnatisectum]|uniref:Uncharacterized protein n=1 Tax=Solanum pinnatisectum TaxID=50273 RepID=A0AAV9LFM0_9SOLN|nr:hypothetical protein R3W88_027002 [Solanum pinnatisectum]